MNETFFLGIWIDLYINHRKYASHICCKSEENFKTTTTEVSVVTSENHDEGKYL